MRPSRSTRSRISLFLILSVLLIPASLAVWDDSTGVVLVGQGDVLQLGEHSIRIIDANLAEGVPFIEIKRKAGVIYKGFIETDKPVEVKNEVFVEYFGSSERFHYGPQVKLRVYQWVDGNLGNVRFPRYLNRETFYDTWVEVENTGSKDAVFRTELTQGGKYDARSGRFLLSDGSTNAIILDLAFPSQNVRVPVGSLDRVEYNDLAGNRRQQSLLGDPQVRAGNSIEKRADVVFKLYFKDQLLDQVVIPDVGYGKSPSGFINDIDIPDVMVRNNEYESRAIITNAGPGANNIDTGKLNLQLQTKGFTIGPSINRFQKSTDLQVSEDLLRKGLLSGETDDWRFSLTPHVPQGEYVLEFRLWQNRHDYLYSTYDTFTKRVRVVESPFKLIAGMVVPPSVMVGSTIPIEVRLNNVGKGQLLNVNVRAPTLLDGPVKKVVTVPTDSELSLSYEVPALVPGKAPITVEVYPHKASNAKWNDPYSESGYLLDAVTKNVEVLTGEEGPSLPPLPADLLPPQDMPDALVPQKPSPIQPTAPSSSGTPAASKPSEPTTGQAVLTSPPKTQPSSAWVPSMSASSPALTLLMVLIIVAVLLASRVVVNHYRRKSRLESHEAVSRHLKGK